jgi:hypothetical protein
MRDVELDAMKQIAGLLEPLSAEARSRVVSWIVDSLEIGRAPKTELRLGNPKPGVSTDFQFGSFAELFHAADPKTEKEKALIAAFWVQRSRGADQFGSQELNTELKNIGYRIGNITDALSQLIAERPNLVIQVAKSGSTKQARKTYKITDAGFRHVSEMLAANSERNEE